MSRQEQEDFRTFAHRLSEAGYDSQPGLAVRIITVLERSHMMMAEITALTDEDFLDLRQMGQKSLALFRQVVPAPVAREEETTSGCAHVFRFLRRENRSDADAEPFRKNDDRERFVEVDLYYCERCLTYRTVELERLPGDPEKCMAEYWRQIIPAAGWFAVYASGEGSGRNFVPLIAWALVDGDYMTTGVRNSDLIGLTAPYTAVIFTAEYDSEAGRFLGYATQEQIDNEDVP